MVNRLIIFFVFFSILVKFSYSQPIEKIDIKSAGWKDISENLALDFYFDLNDSLKEESNLGLITSVYKAYKDNFSLTLLKNRLEREDVNTKKRILYDILTNLDKKEYESFYKNFESYLNLPQLEDIRFFYYFVSGKLDNYKGRKNIFNDLKDAIIFYFQGDFKKSLEIIEPYRDKFPRIYVLLLIRSGKSSQSIDFIEKLNIKDKDYLKALAYYSEKRYEKVIEVLKEKRLDYKEKLLYIDSLTAMGNFNVYDFQESLSLAKDISDEFNIFRNLKFIDSIDDKGFKDKAYLLKIKWQMKNYAKNLGLYLEEIKKFQDILEKLGKDFISINESFNRLKDSDLSNHDIKQLREKIVAINELYEGIKKFKKKLDYNTTFLSFFEQEYEKEKKEIEKLFNDLKERYKEEIEGINKEIYARKLEKTIIDLKNSDKQDIYNILNALKRLDEETEERNFTFKEKILYYQIYLINELIYLSARDNIDEKTKLINEAISLSKRYLERFSERRGEIALLMAELYEELGEFDKALETFYDYLQENKTANFRTYMKIAEILFEKKEYDKAIGFYEKAASLSKDYKDSTYYKIGWCYYLTGKYEKVINIFLNYRFEKVGEKQELLLNEMIDLLARAFYKLDNIDIVEAYLDKNKQFPYPDKVFKYLGDLYLYLANYEKAIDVYKRGWNKYYLFKNSYEIALSMIDAYNFMGRQEEAYKERLVYIQKYNKNSDYYDKYKEFPPGFGDEIIMTAFFYNNKYDREKKRDYFSISTQLYESLLEYFPEHKRAGEVSFMLAQLYEEEKDYRRAVKFFRKAGEFKFNEEESEYKGLFCEYIMWKKHEILSKELIQSIESFLLKFSKSKYFNNTALVLADISLKEGLIEKMYSALELASNNDEGLRMTLDFMEANFDVIDNKLFLAKMFDKGFKKFGDDKYLKLKHFSLFKYAIYLEGEGRKDYSASIYKEIINDKRSDFTEFALYNLSLLLQREGKTDEAILYMSQIDRESDLKLKAKEFIYIFGKQKGMFIESAKASLDYAQLVKDKEIFYLIESAYLFIKGKAYDDAKRVLIQLNMKKLTDIEKKERDFLDGLINYYRGNYDIAYDLLISGLKFNVLDRFDSDVEEPIHNILAKTVFTKPEDEARESLELYVDYLSKKYKETSNDEYLYKLGYILNEFALFFLQQKEAKTRAIALLKRTLRNSVEKNNKDLLIRSLNLLKEINPERYGRTFKIEPPKDDLESIIGYEYFFN